MCKPDPQKNVQASLLAVHTLLGGVPVWQSGRFKHTGIHASKDLSMQVDTFWLPYHT